MRKPKENMVSSWRMTGDEGRICSMPHTDQGIASSPINIDLNTAGQNPKAVYIKTEGAAELEYWGSYTEDFTSGKKLLGRLTITEPKEIELYGYRPDLARLGRMHQYHRLTKTGGAKTTVTVYTAGLA